MMKVHYTQFPGTGSPDIHKGACVSNSITLLLMQIPISESVTLKLRVLLFQNLDNVALGEFIELPRSRSPASSYRERSKDLPARPSTA